MVFYRIIDSKKSSYRVKNIKSCVSEITYAVFKLNLTLIYADFKNSMWRTYTLRYARKEAIHCGRNRNIRL